MFVWRFLRFRHAIGRSILFLSVLSISLSFPLARPLRLPCHSCLPSEWTDGPPKWQSKEMGQKATGYSAVYELVPHLCIFVVQISLKTFATHHSYVCILLSCPAFLVDGKINFEIEGFPVLGISGASNPKQVHPSMTQGGRGRCEDEEKREGGRAALH